MAQRIYNKSLTRTEKHRVADAIYRMKKLGFTFPENYDYSKITSVSSYESIMKQAAEMGATYHFHYISDKYNKTVKTPNSLTGQDAVAVVDWIVQTKKERQKAGLGWWGDPGVKKENIPKFNVNNFSFYKFGTPGYLSNAEVLHNIQKQLAKHKAVPAGQYIKHRRKVAVQEVKKNLKKSFDTHITNDDFKKFMKAMLDDIPDAEFDQKTGENGRLSKLMDSWFGYKEKMLVHIGDILNAFDFIEEAPEVEPSVHRGVTFRKAKKADYKFTEKAKSLFKKIGLDPENPQFGGMDFSDYITAIIGGKQS